MHIYCTLFAIYFWSFLLLRSKVQITDSHEAEPPVAAVMDRARKWMSGKWRANCRGDMKIWRDETIHRVMEWPSKYPRCPAHKGYLLYQSLSRSGAGGWPRELVSPVLTLRPSCAVSANVCTELLLLGPSQNNNKRWHRPGKNPDLSVECRRGGS